MCKEDLKLEDVYFKHKINSRKKLLNTLNIRIFQEKMQKS